MGIYSGSHGSYQWLTNTEHYIGTILRTCPEVVVDRYVAVAAVDSGFLRLSDDQLAAGWETRLGVGYSPRIRSIDEVPHQYDGPDVVGWDEFYVFEAPAEIGARSVGNLFEPEFAPAPGRTTVFVNWSSFVLHDPDPAVQDLVSLFWPQLERLCPESYIADGNECLTFVSRNRELFKLVHDRLVSGP